MSIINKKIRKGDKVIALAGNYRGQTGTVLSRSGEKALVQGINIKKKTVKKSQTQPNGGFIDIERPIHVSNLKVCDADEKPVKLKVRKGFKGQRELCYKVKGDEVLYRAIKKPKT